MPVEELPAAAWQRAFGADFFPLFSTTSRSPLSPERAAMIGASSPMPWLWRLDDLVRLIGRRRAFQHVSEAKSVGLWLRHGWLHPDRYVIASRLLIILGWHPDANPKRKNAQFNLAGLPGVPG